MTREQIALLVLSLFGGGGVLAAIALAVMLVWELAQWAPIQWRR